MNPNLKIEETFDCEQVWRVVTDPAVLHRICDDNWSKLPADKLKAVICAIVNNPANYALLVSDGAEPVGVFIFYHKGGGVFETHTLMTARCRGADAIRMGKLGTEYMLTTHGAEKLISFCPANIPESYVFARRVGWKYVGESSCKWLKDGIEYAMKAVECNKHDWKGFTLCL